MCWPHTAVADLDPFRPQPPGVLDLVARHQPPGCGDHAPPRRTVGAAAAEEVAHRPRRPRVAGLLGDLAVGDDVARPEPIEHGSHAGLERTLPGRHRVMLPHGRGRRPRMSDIPENDAQEQAQDVVDVPPPEPPRLGLDVPEADALEQAQDVHEIDDDYGA
jgi:hypothetical protein